VRIPAKGTGHRRRPENLLDSLVVAGAKTLKQLFRLGTAAIAPPMISKVVPKHSRTLDGEN